MTIAQDGFNNVERRFQRKQILHAEAGAVNLDAVEGFPQVVEVVHGERYARLQKADEFLGLFQALNDAGFVGRKSHLLRFLQAHLADAVVGEHLADALETDFLFEVGWVDHGLSFRVQN